MCVIFKDVVERETRGQVKVNIFPSSQLGKEREILEAVKMGIVDKIIGDDLKKPLPEV